MKLAILPARGGSKRIPRKNVRDFCGRPMIAWSISAAREAGVFDAIVVSTDDDEIAGIAAEWGAEAPFRRPAELANDHAPTVPVIRHAIRWFQEHRGPVDVACCLYATAPFLEPGALREGLELLQARPEAEFVFAVTTFPACIFRALRRGPEGAVGMFWPENELKRSQDFPEAWHDAGQFYWGRTAGFLSRDGFFGARSFGLPLPRHSVQDIDTIEDWTTAELLFRTRRAARDRG